MQQILTSPASETIKAHTAMSAAFLRLLWRKRDLMAWFVCAGILVTIIIVLLIPNEYESTAQLMPPGWEGSSTKLSAPFEGSAALSNFSGASLAGGLMGTRTLAGPMLGIISSRTMQDYLINRFNLEKVYKVHYLIDARKILTRRTNAKEDKPTGIVSITVTDTSPARARDMAAAYVEELNVLIANMDSSTGHRERLFLEQRVKEVQSGLEQSEKELGQFSSRTETMDQATQSKAILDAITNVQGQLIAAESELQALQATFSPNNVRIKQAEAKVDALRGELQRMQGTKVSDVENSDESQSFPTLRQLPLLGATYQDLVRHTRSLEVAYSLLNAELEASKIEEAEEIPSVKVLDPPVIPQKKISPRRMLLIAVGALSSFLIGLLWVIGHEVWSKLGDSDVAKIFVREVGASLPFSKRKI